MYMCINYINEMHKRMNPDLYTTLENVNISTCFSRELGKINRQIIKSSGKITRKWSMLIQLNIVKCWEMMLHNLWLSSFYMTNKNSKFFLKAIKFKIFSLDSLAYFCHICLYFSQHNSLINNFWKLDSLICTHQLTKSDNSFIPKLQNKVRTMDI